MCSKSIIQMSKSLTVWSTHGLDISIAIINGDWNSEMAHKLPKMEATQYHIGYDVVYIINIRPITIDETLT